MSSDANNLQRLRDALTADELKLLARVLVEDLTQHQIAAATGEPQSTIGSRVVRLRRKLIAAGIPCPLPPRGRRKQRVDEIGLDSEALTRLILTKRDDGPLQGRWSNSRDGAAANN